MAKKTHKYKNVPHFDPLVNRIPLETQAQLHRLKESPEVQARPVVDKRPVNSTT